MTNFNAIIGMVTVSSVEIVIQKNGIRICKLLLGDFHTYFTYSTEYKLNYIDVKFLSDEKDQYNKLGWTRGASFGMYRLQIRASVFFWITFFNYYSKIIKYKFIKYLKSARVY